MSKLKLAICQTSPIVGNFNTNYNNIKQSYDWAVDNDCDMAVFSEGTVHGYYGFDLFQSKHFVDESENTINKLATLTADKKTAIVVGAVTEAENGKPFNSVLVLQNGKIVYRHNKNYLADEGACMDSREFSTGSNSQPFEINDVKIALPICNDIWDSDICKKLVSDADLAIAINSSPYHYGKLSERKEIVKSRIAENNIPFIYTQDTGGYDGVLNDGGSFAFNANGEMAMQLPQFKTANAIVEYEASELKSDTLENIIEDENNFYPTLWNACCFGLQEYVNKNGFKGVVLGLSGGIDSAITASIAVDALGAENVHCVIMPSPYTSQESIEDAMGVINNLGVKYESVNIEPMMKAFTESLSEIMAGTDTDTTEENIQARIRGNIIMAISNKFGYLALTTGNKSENAVGYATLYGDMSGGFNIIKDIYKTDIFKMCEWRNETNEVIPKNIISKPPTAELRHNQTDQDSLPEYDVLDGILKCLLEQRISIEQTIAKGYDTDTVKKVWKLLHLSEYKRQQSAIGLKLTSCSFDYDRLYPISNDFTHNELNKDDK